ncbi:hydroxyproline-rich glycoprotein family protein [Parasponia andersonii]|uniref:Hydroxyproline-rich glycoprotein family protein n=1 Tax=Parasponia andersonii TaxID=3476 RepID=A0A2P5B3G0_PARAD|nr:hydroxyproline-rich glycoprotein family protein [Parasponia andersonii]
MAIVWCKESQSFKRVAGNVALVGLVGGLTTIFLICLVSFSNYVDSKSGPQTEPLLLYLDSFSVSNLRVSRLSFSAQWEAQMTFQNRNDGLKVILNSFKIFVYRKEREALTCAVVDDMEIEPKRHKMVHVKFDTRKSCGFEKPGNQNEVVKDLKEDVKSGLLGFSLRMKISAFYRMRLLGLGTTVVLTPYCPELNVVFVAAKGEGKMAGGRNCSIPLPKL